jgi:Activator of Hsp90 ATPase homolog 1-like protein
VIEIVPDGAGCQLTLTHEMKPERAEYASRTEAGWASILDRLAATLSGSSEPA